VPFVVSIKLAIEQVKMIRDESEKMMMKNCGRRRIGDRKRETDTNTGIHPMILSTEAKVRSFDGR